MKTIKTTSVELIIEEGVVQGFYYREGSDVKMYVAKRANTEDIGRLFGKKEDDSINIPNIPLFKSTDTEFYNPNRNIKYLDMNILCHLCGCPIKGKGGQGHNGACECECHKK